MDQGIQTLNSQFGRFEANTSERADGMVKAFQSATAQVTEEIGRVAQLTTEGHDKSAGAVDRVFLNEFPQELTGAANEYDGSLKNLRSATEEHDRGFDAKHSTVSGRVGEIGSIPSRLQDSIKV
jgi:hypothetical protein